MSESSDDFTTEQMSEFYVYVYKTIFYIFAAARFGCHPCINTSSLAFSTQDLTEKLLPALGHAPVLVDLPEDSDA